MNPAPFVALNPGRRCGGGDGRWRALSLVLALLAGLVAVPVRAADCLPGVQELSPAEITRGLRSARDHGFLWRLTKRGRDSWLYGTIHIAKLDWMFPGPTVLAAVQASDQVARELDMMDPDIQRRLGLAVVARPGAAPLPAPLATRLARQAEQACVGKALDGLRPEIQAVTLSTLALRGQGLQPAYGVDGYLSGLARGLGKPVLSLESPEAQIRLLVHDDDEATQQTVAEMLDDLEQGDTVRTTARLAQAWADSRLAELENYPQWCQCLDTEARREEYRQLLDERNLLLADAVAQRHDQGRKLFVAVGALHMVGPQGLPALLAKRGFRVEAVRFAAAH
jgi:uncharacterized protein YbaP (TraB family)